VSVFSSILFNLNGPHEKNIFGGRPGVRPCVPTHLGTDSTSKLTLQPTVRQNLQPTVRQNIWSCCCVVVVQIFLKNLNQSLPDLGCWARTLLVANRTRPIRQNSNFLFKTCSSLNRKEVLRVLCPFLCSTEIIFFFLPFSFSFFTIL